MRVCRSCRAACPEAAPFCLSCGTELPSWCGDDAERLLGQVIADNFRLIEVIGEGAMGRVYRAEQLSLGKSVALKLLLPRLRKDASFTRRFENEARAASRLNHPNSVAVIDFGQLSSGEPYIVMEYVRGRTLRQVNAAEFPLRPSRVAGIAAQIAGALGEAHALGVLHRDLKPDNVIIQQLQDGRDHVKVVDFGLASLFKTPPTQRSLAGQIWGTPQYLSPERLRGDVATPQSDIYAIGAMLYELLLGVPPFEGRTALEVVSRALKEVPLRPTVRRPELRIHPALEDITMRCIDVDPGARYASASELRERLEAFVVVRSTDHVIDCPRCGSENRIRARFCSECGLALVSASGAEEALFREHPTELHAQLTDTTFLASEAHPPGVPLPRVSTTLTKRPLDSRPVAAVPRDELVGRTRELHRLTTWLGESGDGAIATLVAGEAGIGKSRLARELALRASASGYRCVQVGADPTRAADPWWPIAQLGRALLGLGEEVDRAQVEAAGRARGLDAGDSLGLCEVVDVADVPAELERTVRLRELRSAMGRLVAATARVQPLLLLFEDLDRYDRPSLRLLAELVAKPPEATLKLLFTARRTDPVSIPERVQRLQLTPLGPDDMAVLGAQIARLHGLDPTTLEAQAAMATPGLPLSVEQLRFLVAAGRSTMPNSLPDLVATRLTWMAPASRRVLQTAACVGLEASAEVLAELAGNIDAFSGALRYLEEAGWIDHDLNTNQVVFRHELLQEVVYAMTPRAVMQELHQTLAVALARRNARSTTVAVQRFRAGNLVQAVPDLEAAGDRCSRRFDDHAACDWYRRAWDAAQSAAAPEDARIRSRIALKLATALRFAGEVMSAVAVAREGLEATVDAGDDIGLRRLLANLAVDRAALAEARQELEAACATARTLGEPETIAGLEADLSVVLASQGNLPEAIALLREAVEHSRQLPGGVPWRVLARLGELCWYSEQTEEARANLEEALAQARRSGSTIGVARVHALLAGLLVRLGENTAAGAHRSDAVVSLRAIGDRVSALELEVEGAEATQRIPPPPEE